MKKKPRILFLVLFLGLIIVSCTIITGLCAKEITTPVYFNNFGSTVIGTHYTTENGNVEIKEVSVVKDVVEATFVPKSIGADTVTFYTETDDPDQNYDIDLEFYAGPFNTLFSFQPLIDFEGSFYVICLLIFSSAVFTFVLIYSFIDAAKKARFGYTMIACGGIGLFSLHYLIVSIYTLIGSLRMHYEFGFGRFVYEFAESGDAFSKSFSVAMAIFCVLLAISNLSLLRHEGYRVQNLLGIMLGIIWLLGFGLNLYLDEKVLLDVTGIYIPLSNAIAALISYFECMLFSTALSAFLASRNLPPFDRDYIVILGCAIRGDGSLTPILQGRVDAAIDFAEKQFAGTNKRVKFIPSGGQGSDEVIAEGEAMKRYLIEQGIESQYILPETRSVNTFENIKLSKEIIEADSKDICNAAFATTNYHVLRGYILSEKLGLKNARGISAKTKWYFFPNAFLRELVGLIVDRWKLHLVSVLLILSTVTGIYLITC